MKDKVVCPRCHGDKTVLMNEYGLFPFEGRCPKCKGKGYCRQAEADVYYMAIQQLATMGRCF